ncbi:MAG: lysophospholipid acyltransferase family protein, partial [Akkermansiaceae bacterium]
MNTAYWFCYTLFQKAALAFFSYRVVGSEKLVTDGSVLIASNHESFLDPPLVGTAYKHPVYYLARKSLFRGPAAWLYPRLNAIPVDQERPDM